MRRELENNEKKGLNKLKRGKKLTAILVTAMVMTVAMVVVAYAADYTSNPAWNTGTGRYTQLYELSVGYNWKFTNQVDVYASLQKMYPERDALVQCTVNELTAFPTYYQVRKTDASGEILSDEASHTGTGIIYIDYPYTVSPHTLTCLGIRTDPRCSSSVTNEGSWSPDRY